MFPVSNENWKILKRSLTKDSSQILTIRTDTSFHPWALPTSKAQIIEIIFAGSRFTNGGLADNPQVTYCLSQLRNIALQKKKRVEGIHFY